MLPKLVDALRSLCAPIQPQFPASFSLSVLSPTLLYLPHAAPLLWIWWCIIVDTSIVVTSTSTYLSPFPHFPTFSSNKLDADTLHHPRHFLITRRCHPTPPTHPSSCHWRTNILSCCSNTLSPPRLLLLLLLLL